MLSFFTVRGGCWFFDIGGIVDHLCLNFFCKEFEDTEDVIIIRKSKDRQWPQESRSSVGWACVACLSFCFEETLHRTFHRCFLPRLGSFGQAVSEETIFRNQSIRNKNCLWWLCFLRIGTKWAIFIEDHP